MREVPKIQLTVLCGPERHFWIHPFLVSWAVTTRNDERFDVIWEPAYGYPTSQEARNWASDVFLESDCDFLFMIDNDMIPNVEKNPSVALVDLLGMAGLFPDPEQAALIGAPSVIIQKGVWSLNAYRKLGIPSEGGRGYRVLAAQTVLVDNKGLFGVDAIGSGCVIMTRKAVQTLSRQAGGVVWLRPRGKQGETIIGEDLLLCTRLRDLGGCVYCSPEHLIDHAHTLRQLSVMDIVYNHQEVALEPEEWGCGRGLSLDERDAFDGMVGSWSITKEMGLWLKRKLLEWRPRNSIEFGSGVSTFVIRHAVAGRGGELQSVESDPARTKVFRFLGYNVNIRSCSRNGWYRLGSSRSGWAPPIDDHYDFIFVDGPAADGKAPSPRMGAADFVGDRLAPGGVAVYDDINRGPEKEVFQHCLTLLPCTHEYVEFGDRVFGVLKRPEK